MSDAAQSLGEMSMTHAELSTDAEEWCVSGTQANHGSRKLTRTKSGSLQNLRETLVRMSSQRPQFLASSCQPLGFAPQTSHLLILDFAQDYGVAWACCPSHGTT